MVKDITGTGMLQYSVVGRVFREGERECHPCGIQSCTAATPKTHHSHAPLAHFSNSLFFIANERRCYSNRKHDSSLLLRARYFCSVVDCSV